MSTGLDVSWLAHLYVLVKAGTASGRKEASSQLSVVGSQIEGLPDVDRLMKTSSRFGQTPTLISPS